MLEFREEDHTYLYSDRVVPSVTQAIDEWLEIKIHGTRYYVHKFSNVVISYERMRDAQQHGRAVHKAGLFAIKGTLDWSSLHYELKNPVEQLIKWAEDFKIKPILLEKPLYSKTYRFAGTPDFIGTMRGIKHRVVVDYASGAYMMKGLQTAAYEQLYRENYKYRGKMVRFVLHLPKQGPYDLVPQKDAHDWAGFKIKLMDWYQERRRKNV